MAALLTASFESRVLPDVIHLLRSESGAGGIATYKQQVLRPVDKRVLLLVGDLVEK